MWVGSGSGPSCSEGGQEQGQVSQDETGWLQKGFLGWKTRVSRVGTDSLGVLLADMIQVPGQEFQTESLG